MNKVLEQVIVKSVAGLTNARGGVLLIGVADDGEIVGIEKDIQMLPKRQDIDGYENHLTTLLENGLGSAATANVGAQFEQVGGHTVCRVTVQPSSITCMDQAQRSGGRVLRSARQLHTTLRATRRPRIHQPPLPLSGF